jgi:hypothetical protein
LGGVISLERIGVCRASLLAICDEPQPSEALAGEKRERQSAVLKRVDEANGLLRIRKGA